MLSNVNDYMLSNSVGVSGGYSGSSNKVVRLALSSILA